MWKWWYHACLTTNLNLSVRVGGHWTLLAFRYAEYKATVTSWTSLLCTGHAVWSSQPSHFVKKQDPESLSCLHTLVQSFRLVERCLKVSRLESDADGYSGWAFAGSGWGGWKPLKPLAAFGCSENNCKMWEMFAGQLWSCYCLFRSSVLYLLHESNFHIRAGQGSRISALAPSRESSFHETPAGRLWRLLTFLRGGQWNMFPVLLGCL